MQGGNGYPFAANEGGMTTTSTSARKASRRSSRTTRNSNSRRWPAATSCSACGRRRKLGITGAEAEAYAKEVVMADFEEAGDTTFLRKSARTCDGKKRRRRPGNPPRHGRIDGAGDRADQGERLRWRPSPSPAACARAKPSTPPGARWPRPSWPRRSRAKALPPSCSISSTGCGTPPRSSPASARCITPAPRRWCGCRSTISPSSRARSTSAPRRSSRR